MQAEIFKLQELVIKMHKQSIIEESKEQPVKVPKQKKVTKKQIDSEIPESVDHTDEQKETKQSKTPKEKKAKKIEKVEKNSNDE